MVKAREGRVIKLDYGKQQPCLPVAKEGIEDSRVLELLSYYGDSSITQT